MAQLGWEATWQDIAELNLANKTVAIFGLGDQLGYAEWFQDAEEWVQNRIREDFYNYFIDEISLAFDRRNQWKSKKQ